MKRLVSVVLPVMACSYFAFYGLAPAAGSNGWRVDPVVVEFHLQPTFARLHTKYCQ
ncbi:hypothetical protein [Cryobacterium sp. Y82]|uniref:hypothetical protein n=1 Tax=Cryobacterium sp. Y82 TaxID=2045017 RepID=UPI00130504FF|nr:hypothetical protein [Cryobacterium sp. Y82]